MEGRVVGEQASCYGVNLAVAAGGVGFFCNAVGVGFSASCESRALIQHLSLAIANRCLVGGEILDWGGLASGSQI
jgi:hypothetical protein